MRKLTLIFITIALIAITPLFAAGGKEEAKTEKVIIWHSAQGSNAEVFEEIAQTFNNTIGKDRNIEIEAIYQGKANDVLTSVNAASGTGNLPDIAMMDATAATDMNHSQYLVTVDKLGIDTSDILACGISSYTSENGLLALPFNASALLYYYNKTLYDSVGVSAPRTLDDMVEVARKTGSKDVAAFAGVPATFELSTLIGAQNGLSYMLNNRNGHDRAATEVLFGKEGTYKAFLEKWKTVYDTGFYSPITSGVTAEFTSGRCAAMLASSSNLASVINSVSREFEVGVAKVPMVNEQATGGTVISGGALFSFTDSQAVKTVLEYLISPDVQAKWSEATGYVPVNTKAYETEAYKSFLEKNPLYKVAIDSLLESNPGLANVWVPSAYSIYYSFQSNIADVLNGKDIDTAVADMVGIVESAIASYSSQNL
ncbi:MAG: extracellular solute-binding protein [Spirochaetales bacterium]|nr:extracellular solute-binding protein [Spirochaetales bacterium]